jgi:membrane associated rhomboid family serine protease
VPLSGHPEAQQKIELWSLVLQAVQVHHQVVQEPGGWVIRVAHQDYDSARRQVAAFEAENENWPPLPPATEVMGSDDFSTLVFMVSLVLFFALTGPWEGHGRWFAQGAVSALKIFGSGEWWRLFTGLTLHADAAHLLGNVFFGGLLLYFLSSQLGSGTGWLIAIFSGAGGNLLNVWFRQGEHLSVGFSTAVFGMVGAFCGLRWFRRGLSFQEFLLPIGAAAALLAFLGTAGERTDLGAHFWGMAVGLVLGGAATRPLLKDFLGTRLVQLFLVGISVGCIGLSWFLALAKG